MKSRDIPFGCSISSNHLYVIGEFSGQAGRDVSQMAGSHRTHTGIEKGNDAIDRLEGTQTGRHAHGTEAKQ